MHRGIFNSHADYRALAILDLTKAIELSPKNPVLYFESGSACYKQQLFDEALKDINIAIALDSTIYSWYSSRGTILNVMGDYQKAIDDYTKAISLEKNDYLPYLNRAGAYYKLKNLNASCSDYSILQSLIKEGKLSDESLLKEINDVAGDICDTTKVSYYYQRGIGYYNLKEYQKTIDIYAMGL